MAPKDEREKKAKRPSGGKKASQHAITEEERGKPISPSSVEGEGQNEPGRASTDGAAGGGGAPLSAGTEELRDAERPDAAAAAAETGTGPEEERTRGGNPDDEVETGIDPKSAMTVEKRSNGWRRAREPDL